MRKELSKMTKEEIETERQALTADYRSKIEKLIFTKKNKITAPAIKINIQLNCNSITAFFDFINYH